MLQLLYIIVFLISTSFSEEPKKMDTNVLKTVNERSKVAMDAVSRAMIKTEPETIYAEYLKNEIMLPNLEPIKSRVYGNKNAKNKLVIFADFACGHCKATSKDLKARVNENKQLVNLTYVLFPLDKVCNKDVDGKLSNYSCFSAKLALCAEKNGKIWKAIDYLYEHQDDSTKLPFDNRKFISDMGKKLKLKDFDACAVSKWVDDALNIEATVHKGLKIPGTPIVLLNNRRLGGVYKNKNIFTKFIKYFDLKENPKGK